MSSLHLIKKSLLLFGLIAFSFGVTGCSGVGNALNPFAEDLPPEAFAGSPDDSALVNDGGSPADARDALQGIARYPRAHQPQPQNPVIKPSVVRLMWVPDHLNRHGDLVPAHYYYMKVLDDTWAVTDVHEQHEQISGGSPASHLSFTTGR